MPYAKLFALSASIDQSIDLARNSGQALAEYLLHMASLEVSEQIEKLDKTASTSPLSA